MGNKSRKAPTNTSSDSDELLNELGSLKELLDEEHDSPIPYTSVEQISSVEDYLRIKQQAADNGVTIEEYLSKRAGSASNSQTTLPDSGDEGVITLLEEVNMVEGGEIAEAGDNTPPAEASDNTISSSTASAVEEYFRSVAAAKRPQQSSAASGQKTIPDATSTAEDTVPVLSEIASENDTQVPGNLSAEEMQELVDLIVNRKLQSLKSELEKEVMGELHKLLPHSVRPRS